MSRPVGATDRSSRAMLLGIYFAILLVAAEIAADRSPQLSLAVLVTISFAAVGHRLITRWRNLVVATLLVILFVPMRKYGLPASLPFELEPYRLLIAVIAVLWVACLLVDPLIRLRRTMLDVPIAAVLLVATASNAVNAGRLADEQLSGLALKSLTFLFSFALVYYLIVSVIKTREDLDALLKVFVGGGAIVAGFALVELWGGFNVFDHLDMVAPVLVKTAESGPLVRGGYTRVFASAQHPIALGSLFVLLVPLTVYLYMSTKRMVWLGAGFLLCVATFATVSRTGVLSLVVVAIVFVILRPREMVRFWPLLLPVLLAVKIAMPGILGTFYKSFFPEQGLIAEQADGAVGSSRVASFGPAMDEVSKDPLLGVGYGTRIPSGPEANSFIVDDQWLATAMDTGFLGVISWAFLFVVFLRLMFRASRRVRGEQGWLFTGLAASAFGFAIGMITFDAFSFIQVTFGLFVVFAVGSLAYAAAERDGLLSASPSGPRAAHTQR